MSGATARYFFSLFPLVGPPVSLSSLSTSSPHPIAITIVAFLATFPLSLPPFGTPKKKAEVSPHSRKKGKRGVGKREGGGGGGGENHDAALAPKMDGDGRGWTYCTTVHLEGGGCYTFSSSSFLNLSFSRRLRSYSSGESMCTAW